MMWVDNLLRAKPTGSTEDEYILGHGHGVDGAVAEIKKQHSLLDLAFKIGRVSHRYFGHSI